MVPSCTRRRPWGPAPRRRGDNPWRSSPKDDLLGDDEDDGLGETAKDLIRVLRLNDDCLEDRTHELTPNSDVGDDNGNEKGPVQAGNSSIRPGGRRTRDGSRRYGRWPPVPSTFIWAITRSAGTVLTLRASVSTAEKTATVEPERMT